MNTLPLSISRRKKDWFSFTWGVSRMRTNEVTTTVSSNNQQQQQINKTCQHVNIISLSHSLTLSLLSTATSAITYKSCCSSLFFFNLNFPQKVSCHVRCCSFLFTVPTNNCLCISLFDVLLPFCLCWECYWFAK